MVGRSQRLRTWIIGFVWLLWSWQHPGQAGIYPAAGPAFDTVSRPLRALHGGACWLFAAPLVPGSTVHWQRPDGQLDPTAGASHYLPDLSPIDQGWWCPFQMTNASVRMVQAPLALHEPQDATLSFDPINPANGPGLITQGTPLWVSLAPQPPEPGRLDPAWEDSFAQAKVGTAPPNQIQALSAHPDGTLWAGGFFSAMRPEHVSQSFVRLGLNGQPILHGTPTLDPSEGTREVKVRAIVPADAEGGVYVGGDFRVRGTAQLRLMRLSKAGVLDTTFAPQLHASAQEVQAIAVAPDGIWIAQRLSLTSGRFEVRWLDFTGKPAPGLTRKFEHDGGDGSPIRALLSHGTGVVLGGTFSWTSTLPSANGQIRPVTWRNLLRLTSAGTVDSAWPATLPTLTTPVTVGVDNTVRALVSHPTKPQVFLVLGSFERTLSPQVTATQAAVIIGSDGLIFSSFSLPPMQSLSARVTLFNAVADPLAPQRDFIVGGNFVSMDGQHQPRTARIRWADGSRDPSWKPIPPSRTDGGLVLAAHPGSASAATTQDSRPGVWVGGAFPEPHLILMKLRTAPSPAPTPATVTPPQLPPATHWVHGAISTLSVHTPHRVEWCRWYHQGQLQAPGIRRRFALDNQELWILGATDADAGEWQVEAKYHDWPTPVWSAPCQITIKKRGPYEPQITTLIGEPSHAAVTSSTGDIVRRARTQFMPPGVVAHWRLWLSLSTARASLNSCRWLSCINAEITDPRGASHRLFELDSLSGPSFGPALILPQPTSLAPEEPLPFIKAAAWPYLSVFSAFDATPLALPTAMPAGSWQISLRDSGATLPAQHEGLLGDWAMEVHHLPPGLLSPAGAPLSQSPSAQVSHWLSHYYAGPTLSQSQLLAYGSATPPSELIQLAWNRGDNTHPACLTHRQWRHCGDVAWQFTQSIDGQQWHPATLTPQVEVRAADWTVTRRLAVPPPSSSQPFCLIRAEAVRQP